MPSRWMACPRCGGVCQQKATCCLACHTGRPEKRKPLPVCVDCEAPMFRANISGRCVGCYREYITRTAREGRLKRITVSVVQGNSQSRMPREPCPHYPGSPGRMATLQARAEAGESMVHPGDCRRDAS